LTLAASLNHLEPGAERTAARAAATALATVLANVSVQSVIEGHYKAMVGPASQTDLLEVTETASVTVTIEGHVEINTEGTVEMGRF
jgi:hypothetical protein